MRSSAPQSFRTQSACSIACRTETILLFLSIRILKCDDPNFRIPSNTLALHLWPCEIVSAS
jgi:hypothetical protein